METLTVTIEVGDFQGRHFQQVELEVTPRFHGPAPWNAECPGSKG